MRVSVQGHFIVLKGSQPSGSFSCLPEGLPCLAPVCLAWKGMSIHGFLQDLTRGPPAFQEKSSAVI